MEIKRKRLQEEFRSFALSGNGVVLGHPGTGKTHTIKAYCRELDKEKRAFLYVPIDKLGIETLRDLSHSLRIPNNINIVSFLKKERKATSESQGLLIIDGFDAARSYVAQRQLLVLIQSVINELSKKWRVIVSVRTYDATKSEDLWGLFPLDNNCTPPATFQTKVVKCRHFYIPLLEDDEVQTAVQDISGMPDLYQQVSKELRELLRTPFNLWLLEQLLADETLLPALTAVNSEIELLGLFWKERVDKGLQAESREMIASRIARALVEAHRLSIRKDQVYDPAQETAWRELLSANVLEEFNRQRIGFSHNIFFDYAVSILLIEDTPEDFESFVSADPSRPLFLRPSLNHFFTRLWHTAPGKFWSIFWHSLPSKQVHLRLFARLLPTGVVVAELRSMEEIQPLFDYREQDQELVDEAILRILQALRALDVKSYDLWTQILLKISADCRSTFVGELANCTSWIFDTAKKAERKDIQASCGAIVRNIMNWIWKQRGEKNYRYDRLASAWLVPLIAETFSTAPAESREALLPILQIVKEAGFPIGYLYHLTHELNHIVSSDPDFVRHVYGAVSEKHETSEEKTDMGSPVMPLSSTRRQDYQMCQYNLKSCFPEFIEAAPEIAAGTAIDYLTRHIIIEHIVPYLSEDDNVEEQVKAFPFRGKEAHYLADNSYAWGQTRYPEDPLEIASILFDYLDRMSRDPTKNAIVETLMDIFRDEAAPAFFWTELLKLGTKNPERLAESLLELTTTFPIQTGNETIHQLACFVEAAVKQLSPEQLLVLEKSFLSLPSRQDEQHSKKLLVARRNRLLTRIPKERLQTEEARAIIAELEKKREIPKNEPLVIFEGGSRPYHEEDWLKEQGADLSKEANAKLIAYFEPLDKFSKEWRNKKPTPGANSEVAPVLRKAFNVLHVDHGGDKPAENSLWTKVGECAETMAKATEDALSDEFNICRQVLLECSRHPEPLPDSELDEKYDQAFWSPAPRNSAAQGLPWIALWAPADTDVVAAVEALIKDPKPTVRYLATSGLFRLSRNYQDIFWKIVEYIAENETNKVVLQALCHTLVRVVCQEEEKTCLILDKLAAEAFNTEDHTELLNAFVDLVMWLYIVRKNGWAIKTTEELLKQPPRFRKALNRATLSALEFITPQKLQNEESLVQAERAKEWISKAIESAAEELRSFQSMPKEKFTEEVQAVVRDVYGIIDEVIMRFYFSSGLFNESQNGPSVSEEQRKNFYDFIKPVLNLVVDVTACKKGGILFARTAHNFMELLNGVIKYDPQGVLRLAYRVASISRNGGYNFDSMAEREVVKLVESVLANHRVDVRDVDSLNDLLGLLDIFADVGWPEALRLVWRLDEIFR